MLQATAREKRSRVGRVSVSLRLVQRTEEVPVPAAGASRPAWAGLYAIVCLAILMLFSVDFVFPTAGPARTAADVLVVLL